MNQSGNLATVMPAAIDNSSPFVSAVTLEPPPSKLADGSESGLHNQLLGELKTRLSHYLTYPLLARSRGWEGTVLLALRIESDGRLEKVHVERGSGYAVLDHSALDSLNRLGRLTEASAWLEGRSLDMQLPVIYRLIEN
jgi:protein TonB